MKKSESLTAGIFIIVTLALLGMIIFIMGSEKQIFSDQEEYFTAFTDVQGLAEGAPVRLAGIAVGRVANIGFGANTQDARVHVKFLVSEKYLDRMRTESVTSIETQGLLGDRFLNIVPGRGDGLLAPGSTLNSVEASDMAKVLNKASQIVDNTVKISENVNDFIKKLRSETLDEITQGSKSFAKLLTDIEKGNGLLHRMIYSKQDGESVMKAVTETSRDINSLISEIKSGDGLLHTLIYDPESSGALDSFAKAADALAVFSQAVSEITSEVKSGNGLAHQLIYGDASGDIDEVIAKFNESADNFKRASQALASGSGTLGALILDPLLYDKLVEVTDGAQRSLILRYAIRSSLNK